MPKIVSFVRAQAALEGLMAPELLCKGPCKVVAGNVVHFALQAALTFLSDANYTPAIDVPTFAFPALPADTGADIDASIDCLCAASVNLGAFLTPIKAAVATFIPNKPIAEMSEPCCVAKGRAGGRSDGDNPEYYELVSLGTCDDAGYTSTGDYPTAKEVKEVALGKAWGFPMTTGTGGDEKFMYDDYENGKQCCYDCSGDGCPTCHGCPYVQIEDESECEPKFLDDWPSVEDGS